MLFIPCNSRRGDPLVALKIVYPICCGIDVHKTFVVACIASTNDKGVTVYNRRRFSTYTKGLRELSQWLWSKAKSIPKSETAI